ncbi:diguanylate cyclase (GGDEF) domain-containing protein [Oribacterium sp. KHPX15]|nr:diguanylate cyclase (GGDEF) domain-containing protein [Oribacterium sp. KHPX15]
MGTFDQSDFPKQAAFKHCFLIYKEEFMSSLEYLKILFTTTPDVDVQNRADDENAYIMKYLTFGFAVAELIAMVIFLLIRNGHYSSNYSVKQASIGFLINFGYCILVRFARFFSRNRTHRKILNAIYFIALILWSIHISIYHYKIGMQISIFYVVMMGVTCLVTLPPKFATAMILLAFDVLFFLAYRYDGAANIHSVNYFSLAFMCVTGSVMRFKAKIRSISQMIELERINAVLGKEAREDKITGLRNRFGLKDDYQKLVSHEICIIMIDIDHFKKFNDTYGHIVGDRVLIDVSNALKGAFSPGIGYRFGGDELMVILRDIGEDEVKEKISLFRKKIGGIEISEVEHKITCSVGYAFGRVEGTEDFEEVNRQADNKLYESKKHRPEWVEK